MGVPIVVSAKTYKSLSRLKLAHYEKHSKNTTYDKIISGLLKNDNLKRRSNTGGRYSN